MSVFGISVQGKSILVTLLSDGIGQIAQRHLGVGTAELSARNATIAILAQHQRTIKLDGLARLEAGGKDRHTIGLDHIIKLHHFVVRERPSKIPRNKAGGFQQLGCRHGESIGGDAKLQIRKIRTAHHPGFLDGIVVAVAVLGLFAISLLAVAISVTGHSHSEFGSHCAAKLARFSRHSQITIALNAILGVSFVHNFQKF